MYKTILFASDLTEQSNVVGQKAKTLAKSFGADLHLVHVVEPVGAYAGGLYYLDDLNEELEKEATASLNQQGSLLGVSKDMQTLVCGHTKESILNEANKIHADLIVLGTHGAKGFGVLLGSTASSVLNSAHCDVLTVPVREDA